MIAAKRSYNTYSSDTKLQVVNSEVSFSFIEANIPRTTIIYWLKNASRLKKVSSQPKKLSDARIQSLELKLKKEKSLKELLIKVRNLHPYSFSKKKVKLKSVKKKIIEVILDLQKIASLKECLFTIGLAPSTYYRWLSIFRKCEFQDQICKKRMPHQLTVSELSVIKYFVTTRKYSHIPISSLHLLAQRMNKVFCSLDSWYKYTNLFDWRRPEKKSFKKIYKEGIRAQKPNEYWHIDVSYIILPGNKKLYFQAVIDNYSRYILAWNIQEKICHKNTIQLLDKAKQKVSKQFSKVSQVKIVMDGGPENVAQNVADHIITSKNLKRLIAQVDIQYSNSLIEAFFKSLKNNYLYFQKLRSKEDVIRKIKFYIHQHNEVMPKLTLKGATPLEAFKQTWNQESIEELKIKKRAAIQARKTAPQLKTCGVC